MEPSSVHALVLAGRRNDGALREASDAEWEALIDVCGRPMVGYVVEALASARHVAGGMVVGPSELATFGLLPAGFTRVEPGASLLDNLRLGVDALAASLGGQLPEAILVSTSDVPLLTAAMVDAFLARTGDMGLDVYVPVVRRETAEARFPGVHRTYIHLRDGAYTMGNLFLVHTGLLRPEAGQMRRLEAFVRLRKAPLQMARTLGPRLVLGVALHRFTLEDVERVAGARLGIRGRAVVVDDPEIGVDVDKVSDLALCREVLSHLAS